MTENKGWIKIHRAIEDTKLWRSERFSKGQAWIDLILIANHRPATLYIRGNQVDLERGQFVHSLDTLAKRWRWNKRTVKRYFDGLEKEQMIHRRKTAFCTINTVVKYDQYQTSAPISAPQSALQTAPQSTRRVHSNKNVKNEKNEKKKDIAEASPPRKVKPSAPRAAPIAPYTYKKLIENEQTHIRIIGFYAKIKGITDERSSEWWSSFITRHVRAAKSIAADDPDKIKKTMKWLDENADFKWTIETVGKYIDDDLETIAKPKEETHIPNHVLELQEKYGLTNN